MIIKSTNSNLSSINFFELFGDNELAVTKGLAYVLSKNQDAFKTFLKFIGVKYTTAKTFRKSEIKL